MKINSVHLLLFSLILTGLFPSSRPVEASGQTAAVYIVPFEGEVEAGLYRFLSRAFGEAEDQGAEAILVEMNTPGGRVDAALEIVDLILESKVPVSILVTGTAASAGAIISLAAQNLYMKEGTTIGFAAPVVMGGGEMPDTVEEKTLSYVLAQVRSICERRGYSPEKTRLAEAMVDKDIEIPDPENSEKFISPKGKLLGLTAQEAKRMDFIDEVVKSREDALLKMGYEASAAIEVQEHTAERVARFFTGTMISGLLLSIGFIGVMVELRTPGFGMPGIVGVVALGLFFWGHAIAGLAGWEGLILFLVGIILLMIEILVIPGFGITGILGIVCIAGSIVLTLLERPLTSPHFLETFQWSDFLHALTVALSTILTGFLAAMFAPFLFPALAQTHAGRGLFLSEIEKREEGYSSAPLEQQILLGKQGITLSTLRPVGIAEIEGKRIDVISQGQFIPPQTLIEVITVEGQRVVVKPAEEIHA